MKKTSSNVACRGVAMMAAVWLGGCTNMLLPPNVTPVVAPSVSVADAKRRLVSVSEQKAAIEAQFAASEQECYNRFFVNSCLDQAKEKRRSALAYQKAIDIEAQQFQRKTTADERDLEVAKAVKEFEADQARVAAQPAALPVAAQPKLARPGKATLQDRRAAHSARLAERAVRERDEAPQRAAAAKEFEQRRVESVVRQREIATKIADREAKNATSDIQVPAQIPAPATPASK